MGQKVNPHGLRVGVIKDWDSRWYARNEKVGDLVVEDYKLRKYLKKTLYSAGIPKIEIERDNGSIAITQNAIQSTVKHVVEAHHGLSTDNVKVDITNKHDPRMAIHAKIDPGRNAELGELGAKLQNEISSTLEAFTGYPVDSVRITFAGDADVVTPAFTQQATKYSEDTHRQHQPQPVPAHAVGK